MSFTGKENVYTCEKCGGFTVTIDRDEGVTPFMLRCRASGDEGDCDGFAQSAMYPKGPRPAHIPAPSWEWYRPDVNELRKCSKENRDHAERGGLFLRKIGQPPIKPRLPKWNPKPFYKRQKHRRLEATNAK